MKNKKIAKRLIAFFVILAVTAMLSVQAFASVWTFNSSGSGNYPFAPRGYSVKVNGVEKWLDSSNFNHDGAVSGSGNNTSYSISYANGFEEPSEQVLLSEGTYTFKAWFDKQPKSGSGQGGNGSSYNFMAANNETYKDFIVVKTGNGTYYPIGTLASSVSNASRSTSVADPDGHTNQWYVEFEMTITEGTTYVFGFQQGIQANNGNTLVLYPGTTTNNLSGYIGFVSADDTNHQGYYDNHRHDEYKYPVVGSMIGVDSSLNRIYSITTYSFEHSITATV